MRARYLGGAPMPVDCYTCGKPLMNPQVRIGHGTDMFGGLNRRHLCRPCAKAYDRLFERNLFTLLGEPKRRKGAKGG